MDLYAENILDHSKHPHHYGALPNASLTHGEINISCGDKVELAVKLDGDRIADVAWTGEGCAISQAGMSILSDELIGTTIDDALALKPEDIRTLLGVSISARRLKCALLSLHTLRNTLLPHRGLPAQSWAETVAEDKIN